MADISGSRRVERSLTAVIWRSQTDGEALGCRRELLVVLDDARLLPLVRQDRAVPGELRHPQRFLSYPMDGAHDGPPAQ